MFSMNVQTHLSSPSSFKCLTKFVFKFIVATLREREVNFLYKNHPCMPESYSLFCFAKNLLHDVAYSLFAPH